MAFTISVSKKDKDEDFGPEDLELFHEECNGGIIIVEINKTWWTLQCQRCSLKKEIRITEEGTTLLARTATDGEKRKLESTTTPDAYVIQRP